MPGVVHRVAEGSHAGGVWHAEEAEGAGFSGFPSGGALRRHHRREVVRPLVIRPRRRVQPVGRDHPGLGLAPHPREQVDPARPDRRRLRPQGLVVRLDLRREGARLPEVRGHRRPGPVGLGKHEDAPGRDARGEDRREDGADLRPVTIDRAPAHEIVLTGVNLGDFGRDGERFFGLMQELDGIEGIDRYRISSIEPNLLTPEMIGWVARSHRFMPHFHIPLQSGSNDILGLMRRRYRRELYAERVRLIKDSMPHCAIGVDVIVGHPGETGEHFAETLEFLEALDITYLHVFTYSERDNTRALDIRPIVPSAVRAERNKTLRNLSYHKMQSFTQQHLGQTRKVLLEGHVTTPLMEGYTDNYIKVTTPYREEWANRIIDWQL